MSRKSVQVNGVVYDSVKSCCKDLGFCITGVRNFMNKNGIDCIEDGLESINSVIVWMRTGAIM